jgi:hypothetical protein
MSLGKFGVGKFATYDTEQFNIKESEKVIQLKGCIPGGRTGL